MWDFHKIGTVLDCPPGLPGTEWFPGFAGLAVLKLGESQTKWLEVVIVDCIVEVEGGCVYLNLEHNTNMPI